jgi:hypothetical protein
LILRLLQVRQSVAVNAGNSHYQAVPGTGHYLSKPWVRQDQGMTFVDSWDRYEVWSLEDRVLLDEHLLLDDEVHI